MTQKLVYMNIHTGSTGTYNEWWYENEDGNKVNGVDLNEVIEVEKDIDNEWIKVEFETVTRRCEKCNIPTDTEELFQDENVTVCIDCYSQETEECESCYKKFPIEIEELQWDRQAQYYVCDYCYSG